MKGFVLAEQGHVVNILPPVDVSGGKKSQAFSMKNWQHASIIFPVGVSAAAVTSVTVKAGTAAAAVGADVANGVAIAYRLYRQETASGDVLSVGENLASTGLTDMSANDGIFYVIELDASELPDGKPYVQVVIANGANSVIAGLIAVLSGGRYEHRASETVIT